MSNQYTQTSDEMDEILIHGRDCDCPLCNGDPDDSQPQPPPTNRRAYLNRRAGAVLQELTGSEFAALSFQKVGIPSLIARILIDSQLPNLDRYESAIIALEDVLTEARQDTAASLT